MTTPTREPVPLEIILVSLRMVAQNNTETFMIGEDVKTLMDYITHLEQSLESAEHEAFEAGRETDKSCGVPFLDAMKYRGFEDYKTSKGAR